jgi:hypothetical protein
VRECEGLHVRECEGRAEGGRRPVMNRGEGRKAWSAVCGSDRSSAAFHGSVQLQAQGLVQVQFRSTSQSRSKARSRTRLMSRARVRVSLI